MQLLLKLQNMFLGRVIHHCFTKTCKILCSIMDSRQAKFQKQKQCPTWSLNSCSVQLVQAHKAASKAGGLQTVMRGSKQDKGPAVQML